MLISIYPINKFEVIVFIIIYIVAYFTFCYAMKHIFFEREKRDITNIKIEGLDKIKKNIWKLILLHILPYTILGIFVLIGFSLPRELDILASTFVIAFIVSVIILPLYLLCTTCIFIRKNNIIGIRNKLIMLFVSIVTIFYVNFVISSVFCDLPQYLLGLINVVDTESLLAMAIYNILLIIITVGLHLMIYIVMYVVDKKKIRE